MRVSPSIIISTDLKSLLRVKARFSAREFQSVWKDTLKFVASYWMRKFLVKHFAGFMAKGWYPEYGRIFGDKNKTPMIDEGNLKRRMLGYGTDRISGTGNNVTITLPFGRPKAAYGEQLEEQITRAIKAASRKGVKMTRQQAEASVMSRMGYGAENVKKFEQGLQVTSQNERREMARVAAYRVARHIDGTTASQGYDWAKRAVAGR